MTALQLLELPENPMPPGAVVTATTAADGVSIRAVSWPRRSDANAERGTVLLLQGRAEFVEKYFETVGALQARGFAVTTFDWRGQGGSARGLANRHLGHVRGFDEFRLDYAAVRASIASGEPVTVLAHSMGGAVALAGASEGWLQADRLVCTNPMLGLSIVPVEPLSRRLAVALARLGLGTRVVPGGVETSISTLPFAGNRLSRDERRYNRNAALAQDLEWRAIGSPTVGWLVAAYAAMKRLADPAAASVDLPVLMILSERDRVCSHVAMASFAAKLPKGRTVIIGEAEHEILMESDTVLTRFWEAFDDFAAADQHPLAVRA